MKGDFTRSTFDHTKHYSGVRMQQGRVQLDSDWNEQVDIQMHLRKQKTEDVIGLCGAPIGNAGFGLTDNGELMIGAGHYYVHGILCENETECSFEKQDDYSDYMKLPHDEGYYLFYLDVWQRHITAVEDNSIRELALGGPDTATRIKTVWQVKWLKLSHYLETNPCIEYEEWKELIKERNARLAARTHYEEEGTFENPCIIPPGAGYRGLENHLYRVEIHEGGEIRDATFKWSRDNGSIVRAVEKIEDDTITIINSGQDSLHAFKPEQWIEITDNNRELCGKPGTLVRLTQVIDGLKLTFDPKTVIGKDINNDNYLEKYNPKVRRWDQTGPGEIKTGTKWIALEHGIEVCFNKDEYHYGDYWLIPARAAEGIEWLADIDDRMLERFGIIHHYCPLATMKYTGNWELIKDCRRIFPPITELVTLTYAGGDGQEAMPGEDLPAPLEVRVTIGEHPIKDARVGFSVTKGLGSIIGEKDKLTEEDGLASCGWILDEKTPHQQVEATLLDVVLLDKDGNQVVEDGKPVYPSIRFNANLSVADQVAYNPADNCAYLIDSGVTTVQAAIDALCDCKEPGFYIEVVCKWKLDEKKWVTLGNYTEVLVDELINGLHIVCNKKVDETTVKDKPTCYITLYMPVRWGTGGVVGVVGYRPYIMEGSVESPDKIIHWTPTQITIRWLEDLLARLNNYNVSKVLARLTLKGNFIWADDDNDHTLYLDGEAFGSENFDSYLVLPSGDGRRGGDFEMWFWLV